MVPVAGGSKDIALPTGGRANQPSAVPRANKILRRRTHPSFVNTSFFAKATKDTTEGRQMV